MFRLKADKNDVKKQNTHTETWHWGRLETPWTQDVNSTCIERSENVQDRYEVYFSLFEVLQKKRKRNVTNKVSHTSIPFSKHSPSDFTNPSLFVGKKLNLLALEELWNLQAPL